MEDKKNEISIELNPEVAKGTYSNLAIITHSRSEFIVDFASNAKMLLNALMDNVTKYETQFGLINLGNGAKHNEGGTFNLGDLPQFGPNVTKS